MNKKEFERKFLVINWNRFEELNDAKETNRYFPSDKDCTPVEHFKDALAEFRNQYEEFTGKKLDQEYYVCNADEPYAKDVLEIILTDGQWIENYGKEQRVRESKLYLKAFIDIETSDIIGNELWQKLKALFSDRIKELEKK
ncbi:MAG: hypothetical protein GY804_09965 [Alphaproteobacteria bacterium]|nr:hypothetical protein [Alphaproteobacteria bacterium]